MWKCVERVDLLHIKKRQAVPNLQEGVFLFYFFIKITSLVFFLKLFLKKKERKKDILTHSSEVNWPVQGTRLKIGETQDVVRTCVVTLRDWASLSDTEVGGGGGGICGGRYWGR